MAEVAQIAGVDLSIVPINDTVPPSVLCLRHFPADNTTQVLNEGLPNSTYENLWNLHTTVPLFLVLIIVPLVNFKSATFFTKFNSLGTLSAMYLLIFVFVKSAQWGININFSDVTDINYAPQFLPSFPALSGMLALSFFIHNIIITIMRNNRHHKNNGRDLSIAYLLVTLTYALVGTVFYICFPLAKSCIEDCGGRVEKTTPSSPKQDSNIDLSVLCSLAQHETSVLANYTTEVVFTVEPKPEI
uniref:Amino acid transporter transmembrane domain-containing protein n=1 Tax=Timema douglasi TaxID=61478 RepID=A0A7R8VBP8_TIMDO|nr:unnamed protein product [Timema douglasi]